MYQASVENWGDSRYIATTRHSTFVMCTQGKGANPVDSLLAALCACMGHHVQEYFQAKSAPLLAFRVSAESDAAPSDTRIASIAVRIDIGPRKLSATDNVGILEEISKCKVYGTLRQSCRVDIEISTGEVHP